MECTINAPRKVFKSTMEWNPWTIALGKLVCLLGRQSSTDWEFYGKLTLQHSWFSFLFSTFFFSVANIYLVTQFNRKVPVMPSFEIDVTHKKRNAMKIIKWSLITLKNLVSSMQHYIQNLSELFKIHFIIGNSRI